MIENFLVKLFLNKKNFLFYKEYVDKNKISQEYKYIFNTMEIYYAYEDSDLTINNLKMLIETNYSNLKQETKLEKIVKYLNIKIKIILYLVAQVILNWQTTLII